MISPAEAWVETKSEQFRADSVKKPNMEAEQMLLEMPSW
jgi:hypothetical protein